MTVNSVKANGFLSLYNGMSAAVLRQGTYSTVRFAIYEGAKELLLARANKSKPVGEPLITRLPFHQKMIIAGLGGGVGSIFGSPFDLINVRMQNDFKLAPEKRRNYKNAIEALFRISRTEGFFTLYTGFHMATIRGILVTVGQLAFYDEFKHALLRTRYFKDDMVTHFTASMAAGLIATLITMPADVIKTLLMNAKPGELQGIFHTAREVLKADKRGLFKGFWPRYVRLGPFTILTFVFYEKLKFFYFKFF
jgi:dicarboxylate transporter 10